jgi:putative IMPACT (imprinted ancient) family translation regulator
MMAELLSNGKIARATHNMLAYRIQGSEGLPGSGILQDCDDDGEAGAGSRMLHLLQILQVMDVAVVVTRWYGGIHLGADRFKHINNATR